MSGRVPTTDPSPVRRAPVLWPWLAFGVAVVGLLVVYPPFRIVPRGGAAGKPASAGAASAVFEPVTFGEKFWSEQLQPAATRAPLAGPVLVALRRDPVTAAQAHARRVGLGNAAYYFVRGSGRVAAVERSRVLVEIEGATVALRTGPVFGNAVRDGTGLLEVNQVPGLAEFNALSAALNHLVEERVQPALRFATVGAKVTFAGCAEAPESLPADGPLLTFIPVHAEVAP